MRSETLEHWSAVLTVAFGLLAAVCGYSIYYFGKQVQAEKEAVAVVANHLSVASHCNGRSRVIKCAWAAFTEARTHSVRGDRTDWSAPVPRDAGRPLFVCACPPA